MPDSFVPQIARAIGVLTSNSRGVASLAEGVVPWWGAIAGRGAMWGAIVTFILRVCLPLLDTGSCTYCYCDEAQTLVYDGLSYLDAGFFSRNSACLALVFWHKPGAWQPTSELNRNVFYAQLFNFKTTFV